MSACAACLRRTWLLGELNAHLEYRGRAPERLAALLELGDEELICAVAGGETERLLEEHAAFDPTALALPAGVERLCRHDRDYPHALREGLGMPSVLHASGGLDRRRAPLDAPTVAIVGTRSASDYGLEAAHGLARGLAESGVTVVGELANGIGAAVLDGALDGGGRPLAAMAGGLDVCHPAHRRALHRRVEENGCLLAELPCGTHPRSWCHTARARVVAALARVVIVAEARAGTAELLHARLAGSSGRTLGAIPGRVGSPLASGPHALLREGALLVRGPEDVLDAISGLAARTPTRAPRPRRALLEPRLQRILDDVAAGRDTLTKLLAAGHREHDALLALAQLELGDRLVRGDAGRYVAATAER